MTIQTTKDNKGTYHTNEHGAKIYVDQPHLHTLLRVASIPASYEILSVSTATNETPLLTVQTQNGPEAIRVPGCLENWANQMMTAVEEERLSLPKKAEFGLQPGGIAYASFI
ncbi:MAG: hypothetical protein ACK5NA_05440 [Enterococcus sp.]